MLYVKVKMATIYSELFNTIVCSFPSKLPHIRQNKRNSTIKIFLFFIILYLRVDNLHTTLLAQTG